MYRSILAQEAHTTILHYIVKKLNITIAMRAKQIVKEKEPKKQQGLLLKG